MQDWCLLSAHDVQCVLGHARLCLMFMISAHVQQCVHDVSHIVAIFDVLAKCSCACYLDWCVFHVHA